MSNKIDEGWFPSTIGHQVEILYWTTQELVPGLIILAFGVMGRQMLPSIILMIIYFIVYSKYQHRFPQGFAQNLIYLFGLLPYKNCPSYFASRFEE